MQVDLQLGVQQVAQNSRSDWDFHRRLNALFATAFDAHTQYIYPRGYYFAILHPFHFAFQAVAGSPASNNSTGGPNGVDLPPPTTPVGTANATLIVTVDVRSRAAVCFPLMTMPA